MKKYTKHLIIFWLPAVFLLATLLMIGKWEAMKSYAILTIISGIICFIIYKTEYISIDESIVEGRAGLIKVQKLSSNKKNITSVKVEQGVLGKIFNFGTVRIDSASSTYTFKLMNNPDEIKKIILK